MQSKTQDKEIKVRIKRKNKHQVFIQVQEKIRDNRKIIVVQVEVNFEHIEVQNMQVYLVD